MIGAGAAAPAYLTTNDTPSFAASALLDRMVAQAQARGANAVLNSRFTTSYIMNSASEILVYGEAVVLADEETTART